jgi:hypothetical protein
MGVMQKIAQSMGNQFAMALRDRLASDHG